MREKQLKICVVMPAYNEATVISGVILGIKKSFKNLPYFVKIIVINDASTDRTAEIAAAAGATVINHIMNCGAGGATATGLKYAQKGTFDVAATMDADGQHSPDDLKVGIEKLVKNRDDLLIGSRLIDTDGMSSAKIFGNKGLSLITFLLFGIRQSDSQSGLRIFSRKALDKLYWKTSGYEFCSEMLWRAKQLDLKIDEYPIKAIYTDYSKSKGQNNWNAVNIVKSLIKQRIKEFFR